jgi:hypothetical protein
MDLPTAADLKAVVATLAPGIIILGARQSFMAAPAPKLEDRLISYAYTSILYYAAANVVIGSIDLSAVQPWAVSFSEYIAIPAVIGATLGVAVRIDALDWLWRIIRIRPIHHAPTAWDWQFSRINKGTFVLVTLKDGSQVAGVYGDGAFSSSKGGERDLFLSSVYDMGTGGTWAEMSPPRSILLCGRDIKTIEFF